MAQLTAKLEFGSEKDESKKWKVLVLAQAENDLGSTVRSLFNGTSTVNTVGNAVDRACGSVI